MTTFLSVLAPSSSHCSGGPVFQGFWPLSTPFGAVDDEPRLRSCSGLALGKVIGVPLREDTQTIESIPQDGQQPMYR